MATRRPGDASKDEPSKDESSKDDSSTDEPWYNAMAGVIVAGLGAAAKRRV